LRVPARIKYLAAEISKLLYYKHHFSCILRKFFTRMISFHDKQFGCAIPIMTMEGNKVKERQCKKEKKHDSERRNIPSASSVIP